jgi:heme-degrading monooxygenase HmoA
VEARERPLFRRHARRSAYGDAAARGQRTIQLRVFQDILAPLVAEQPGFSGITLLTDARTGKAVTIGLWATEANLLDGERSVAEQEQRARIDALLAGPPAREVYEVCVQVELTAQGSARIRGI